MQILGLDIATSCGLALVDRARPAETWRLLAIECEGDAMEESAADLALALRTILRGDDIAFAAIEMPQRSIARHDKDGEKDGFTINPTTALKINQLTGAVVATLGFLGIPFGLVSVATWRSVYYGKGTKAADKKAWKALAVSHAARMGALLPVNKKAASDAAEALGVAFAWQACTFIPERHQQAFMALRQGRPLALGAA